MTSSSGISAVIWGCPCLLLAMVLCLVSQRAFGGSITVQNDSFELVDCTDLGGGQATSWNTTGGGVFDPQNAQFTGTTGDNVQGELPAGGQVGNVWFGLSQNLGVAAIPGAKYSVNFYVGWRWDKPSAPSFRVQLLEGTNSIINQVVTAPAQGFAMATPLSGVAAGNGTLTLIFTNNTGVSDTTAFVDLVSLTETSILAPASLTAVSGSAVGSVRLDWAAVTNATGYNVKRSMTNSAYVMVGTNVVGTNYTDLNLKFLTNYYYVVSATNSSTSSESTNSAAVMIMLPVPGTVITIR